MIVFHILDEAEALFPFEGMLELEDNETHEKLTVDAEGIKADYLEEVAAFQAKFKKECLGARIDYVPIHTGMPFDKALMSYLTSRQAQGIRPSHGIDFHQRGAGGRGGVGGRAGHPPPVHEADAQAHHLPRHAADPRAAEAVAEEAAGEELAAAARPDGSCWR